MTQQEQSLDPITFPLEGGRLIEASAGTGKTFTISLLYLRLVLGHRGPDRPDARPLSPPEILVSTFTEAAVAELRDRIRARLQQAAWLFAGSIGPQDVDPPLQRLYEAVPAEDRPRGAFLLQRAAEWMDEAAIFTIHGFCQRMLREHAFHSRALFEQELMTDLEPVIHEAVRDFWRTHGYPLAHQDHGRARQFARLLGDPATLRGRIRHLMERDGSPVAYDEVLAHRSDELPDPETLLGQLVEMQQRVDALEAKAREAWRSQRDELHALWQEIREGLHGGSHREAKTPDSLAAWLAGVDAWAAGEAPLEDKTLGKLVKPRMKGKWERPRHPALDAICDWQETDSRSQEETERVQPALEAFAALWIRERIATLLARRRAMGFQDMLIQMREAVEPTTNPNAADMIAAIRAQYPIALIDEFQDTDPLQYAIFSAIYPLEQEPANADHAIVLIGDPKQAIYSFRGADIHSYLTARRATAGRHASLPCNFRSTEAMVKAVNRLFALADEHPDGAFRFAAGEGENAVPFHPVEARGRSARLVDVSGRELPALTCWSTPADEEWNTGDFTREMARRAAGEIAVMLNEGQAGRLALAGDEERHGIQPRDIAVLVRKGEQADAVRQALGEFGVPAVYLSEKTSVFASTEAGDLLLWLEALAEPDRSARIRQALSTASLALSLDEMEAQLTDELTFDETCQRFHHWHRAWREQGVLAALLGLMHHFDVPARLLSEAERGQRRGERRLTNLLHLAEWLQGVDHDVDGEAALVHRLHQAITDGGREQEIRLEQDSEMVRIVTIHGAKGLQYPLVFLPFAALMGKDGSEASRKKNKAAEPTRRHRHGENVWDMHPDEAARERAAREAIAEEIRLLYVALTRAEFACWLGAGPVAIGGKGFNPGLTAFGQFLGFPPGAEAEHHEVIAALERWAEGDGIVLEPVPEPRDPAVHRFHAPPLPALHGPREPTFAAFEPWWIASFSALTRALAHGGALSAPEVARDEQRLEVEVAESPSGTPAIDTAARRATGVHALPRGAQIGTLLHDLIEAIAADGFARYAGRPEALRERIAATAHRGLRTLDDPRQEDVAVLLDRLLAARWALPDAAPMALAGLSRYRTEMEFWLAADGVDAGRLDALVCEAVMPGRERPRLSAQAISGMLKGFIDLTVAHDSRYYVLDWKSNWLGPDAAAYTPEAIEAAMLDHRYDLQFVLYLLALHRHLSERLPDYDYDRHLGGAVYVFLRGVEPPGENGAPRNGGVYACRPDRRLIEALDRLFTGETEDAA